MAITGGGGAANGNLYRLQLCIGQPVASNTVSVTNSMMSLGLFSTAEVP